MAHTQSLPPQQDAHLTELQVEAGQQAGLQRRIEGVFLNPKPWMVQVRTWQSGGLRPASRLACSAGLKAAS